jgi:hypothetical protein
MHPFCCVCKRLHWGDILCRNLTLFQKVLLFNLYVSVNSWVLSENAELLNVKMVVHIVTTGLYRFNSLA